MHKFVFSVILLALMSSPALAEKCSGKWGGRVATSVDFKSGSALRYCYLNDCWNSDWLGDKSKRLTFRVGDGGATVEMTKRGKGYRAVWRNGNQVARADLTCK